MTYKIQIDDEVRDATAEEVKEIKKREAAVIAEQIAKDKIEADKAAILDRIGLTADELKTILG